MSASSSCGRRLFDSISAPLPVVSLAAYPRRQVYLDPHRRAQAGALHGSGEGDVHIEQRPHEDALHGAGERTHLDAREHTDRQPLAFRQRNRRTILHRNLENDVLVLKVTDQAREMLDRLDAAVSDELQTCADLQIHGLEVDILGFQLVRLANMHGGYPDS